MHTVETGVYRTGKLDNARLQKYARDKAVNGVVGTLDWYKQRGLKVVGEPRTAPGVNPVYVHGKTKTAILSDCRDSSMWDTAYKSTGNAAVTKGSKEPDRRPVTAKAGAVRNRWLISEYEIDRTRTAGCLWGAAANDQCLSREAFHPKSAGSTKHALPRRHLLTGRGSRPWRSGARSAGGGSRIRTLSRLRNSTARLTVHP
ncbi:hypothetical protein [Streptomyces longisporoflavus]|uniref:Uncharacterized protein n=1 Tax=Streptomyces longisporoflavus TaxID=28044 RepID=A0ABW7QZK9_9ACTN